MEKNLQCVVVRTPIFRSRKHGNGNPDKFLEYNVIGVKARTDYAKLHVTTTHIAISKCLTVPAGANIIPLLLPYIY